MDDQSKGHEDDGHVDFPAAMQEVALSVLDVVLMAMAVACAVGLLLIAL